MFPTCAVPETAGGDAHYNRTMGADANLVLGRSLQINSYVAKTQTPGLAGNDMAFFGRKFAGQIQYPDHTVDIDAEDAEGEFEEQLGYWMSLLARDDALSRFPSERECGFCNIGKADCDDRVVATVVGAE